MFLLNQISLSHKTYGSILRKKKKKEEKVEGGREGGSTETTKPGIYASQVKRLYKKQCNRKRVSGLDQDSTCKPGQRKIGIGRLPRLLRICKQSANKVQEISRLTIS